MVISGAVVAVRDAELVPVSGSWRVALEERATEVGSDTPDPGRALRDELVGAALKGSVPNGGSDVGSVARVVRVGVESPTEYVEVSVLYPPDAN